MSEQPEVCCSYGELGTSGEWKGNFEIEKVRGHHDNACVLEFAEKSAGEARMPRGCNEIDAKEDVWGGRLELVQLHLDFTDFFGINLNIV